MTPATSDRVWADEGDCSDRFIYQGLHHATRRHADRDQPVPRHPRIRMKASHRTCELARRLYQLQSFLWFDQLLAKVRRDRLSGASFEPDVVWVLQILAQRVSARETQNRLGSDFDISADIGDLTIPVEVKAKDDTTPYSSSTIIQTVRQAARQLLRGECGILFIRVPSAWIGGRLEAEYGDALIEGSRQTSRIGVVITAIDKPHIKK
jgi:hypothetical protein